MNDYNPLSGNDGVTDDEADLLLQLQQAQQNDYGPGLTDDDEPYNSIGARPPLQDPGANSVTGQSFGSSQAGQPPLEQPQSTQDQIMRAILNRAPASQGSPLFNSVSQQLQAFQKPSASEESASPIPNPLDNVLSRLQAMGGQGAPPVQAQTQGAPSSSPGLSLLPTNLKAPVITQASLEQDPEYQAYSQNQGQLSQLRNAVALGPQFLNNLSTGFAPFRYGANLAPDAQMGQIQNQQIGQYLQGNAEDVNRRDKIMNAILYRQSKGALGALGANSANQRANLVAQVNLARAHKDTDAAQAQKLSDNQDKAYTQMVKDMNSYRGNQGAQQAAIRIQNANTALDLVTGKDPDTLTPTDVKTFSAELGRLAMGGVPTDHGMQMFLNPTFRSKAAEILTGLSNENTPAKQGAFIQKNIDYIRAIKKSAQKSLDDYKLSIAKGWKARVKPEQYQEALKELGLDQSTASPQKAFQFKGGDPADPTSWVSQ